MLSKTRNNQRRTEYFYLYAGIPAEIDYYPTELASIRLKKDILAGKKHKFKTAKAIVCQYTAEPNENVERNKAYEDHSYSTGMPEVQHINSYIKTEMRAIVFLYKIIYKPNYITILENKIVAGNFGHSTSILKRPILEGSYFIEFRILPDLPHAKKTLYPSSIRVGLCPYSYEVAIPLGKQYSVGYRSDGYLVSNRQSVPFAYSYHEGDVIGLGVAMMPAYKYAQADQLNYGSVLTFYKNGKYVGKYDKLHQIFYSFAVSLFNYAQVYLILTKENMMAMPYGYNAYADIFKYKVLYRDLYNLGIFNGYQNAIAFERVI